MNNTETQRLAREWAKFALTVPEGSPGSRAAAEHILATTTEPTMADIIWDDEEHTLTGATLNYGSGPTDVTMFDKDCDSFITYVTLGGKVDCEPAHYFTPNGKKYELREVGAPEQPEHPATLVTEQDYANAPVGTVVAKPGDFAWTKGYDGEWRGPSRLTSREMARIPRQVLREGWGK